MAQRLGTYLASLSVLIIMIGALLFWAGGDSSRPVASVMSVGVRWGDGITLATRLAT